MITHLYFTLNIYLDGVEVCTGSAIWSYPVSVFLLVSSLYHSHGNSPEVIFPCLLPLGPPTPPILLHRLYLDIAHFPSKLNDYFIISDFLYIFFHSTIRLLLLTVFHILSLHIFPSTFLRFLEKYPIPWSSKPSFHSHKLG